MLTLPPMLLLPFLLLLIILSLSFQRTHLLMALLLLEGMVLTFVMMFPVFSANTAVFFAIILLTFGACEASLGLSLLVSMTRYYGTDLIKSLTINKC